MKLACMLIAGACFLLLGAADASADCLITGCDPNELKSLTPDERAQLNIALAKELKRIKKRREGPHQIVADVSDPSPSPKASTPEPAPDRSRVKENLRFYLRKDFQDITLFSGPALTSSEDAIGAEFAYSHDQITSDRSWSADGIVAVAYSYINQSVREPFKGFTIAPYFGATREIHSRNTADNVDVKKFGISGEIGFKNPIFTNRSDYIRGSVAAKRDDIAGTDIVHGKLEWLPTWLWDGRKISLGSTGLIYRFTPEFLAQYDHIADNVKTIAFSGKRDSLRLGPEAILWLKLDAPNGPTRDFFRSTTGRLIYHWWTEAYSSRSGSWFDASVTHNLDDDGYVALTLSYRQGQNEDTGVRTDLYKVALSAKLCTDVFSKDPC